MSDFRKLKFGTYTFLAAIFVLNAGMLYQIINIPSDTKPERISTLIEKVQNDQIVINKGWVTSNLTNFQKYAFSSDQLISNLKKLVLLIIFSNTSLIVFFLLYFLILLNRGRNGVHEVAPQVRHNGNQEV